MRGAAIYFSATGNTEYVVDLFKKHIESRSDKLEKINIVRQLLVPNNYDFYIFAAPIHAEFFPKFYVEWIKKYIGNVNKKKCVIVSTQVSEWSYGPSDLEPILIKKGFDIKGKAFIPMPNNYYVVAFKKASKSDVEKYKANAEVIVKSILGDFYSGNEINHSVSKVKQKVFKPIYNVFNIYSKKWALKNVSVNYEKCIHCRSCENNCPTKNISFDSENKIIFSNKCASCQCCIHICPQNAFLYRGKVIEQYKL